MSAVPPPDPPRWIYVIARFKEFLQNLELTTEQDEDGRTKYAGVVSCLNDAYYGTSSNSENSFLIGSWAKGTRVRPPRDVDMYFVLPFSVYQKFETYANNKQSALLQEVRSKLLTKYPSSSIKGDGPIVLAAFVSYNVEVVPAFLLDNGGYWICDTKDGGRYKANRPLAEIEAIDAADIRNGRNVRPLIRMLKCWQTECGVPIKSFLLELMAVEFLDQWTYRLYGLFFYDWMCRDFFKWMVGQAGGYKLSLTGELLALGDSWKSRAESAFSRATKACEWEMGNYEYLAGDEWQKIFGTYIPWSV